MIHPCVNQTIKPYINRRLYHKVLMLFLQQSFSIMDYVNLTSSCDPDLDHVLAILILFSRSRSQSHNEELCRSKTGWGRERHSGRGGVRRENRDPDADADRWREGSWRGAGGGGGGGGVWEVGRKRERETGDITSGGDHPVSDGHYCCGREKLLRTRKIFLPGAFWFFFVLFCFSS